MARSLFFSVFTKANRFFALTNGHFWNIIKKVYPREGALKKEAFLVPPKVIGPKRAISIELLLFLAYSFFSASWMVGSIITPDMAQEFGVYTVPSSVNNAISAAKILGNFVAAWILLKLGPKRTVSLSCLLICAVVVGAFFHLLPPVYHHPLPAGLRRRHPDDLYDPLRGLLFRGQAAAHFHRPE